ncbi:NUDIX hydrolase [Algiphilus sp.]|uniref:NUDIX hydrolase n=1 Tax=Algiphilus sp. TaxID=1872431 RepID=UPI003B52BBE6
MDETAPHVTVATLVERSGQWLFVEERVGGQRVLNQPAGHWEAGETLIEAAVRETLEETRWRVQPTALVGIYSYHPPDLPYAFLRFAFLATALDHDADRPLDPAIEQAVWLSPQALAARAAEHRSPMVQRGVDDALAGRRLALEWLDHLPA